MTRKTYGVAPLLALGPLAIMGFVMLGFFIIGGALGLWGTYKLISADWGRLMIPIIIGIVIIVALVQKSRRPPIASPPQRQAIVLKQGERVKIF